MSIYKWYDSCMISTDPLWNICFLMTNTDRLIWLGFRVFAYTISCHESLVFLSAHRRVNNCWLYNLSQHTGPTDVGKQAMKGQ